MIRLHRRQRFVEYDNPCDYNDREGNEPSPQRRDVEVVLRTRFVSVDDNTQSERE